MELHLMRHAQAAPREDYDRDDERPLTDEGMEKSREAAEGLKALGLKYDRVVSSPLVRARQTAEAVVETMGLKLQIEFSAALGNGFTPDAALDLLHGSKSGDRVLFVGHMPDCGDLASFLVYGDADGVIDFKKGGVARFEMGDAPRPRTATLQWLLTQKHLRLIGKGA